MRGVPFADAHQNPWPLTWAGSAGGGYSGELSGPFAFAESTTAHDKNLARICQTLFFANGHVVIAIGNLEPNTTYRFDVITGLTDSFGGVGDTGARPIMVFAQNSGDAVGTILDSFEAQGGSGPGTGVAYNTTFEWTSGADGMVRVGIVPGDFFSPGTPPSDGAWLNAIVVTLVGGQANSFTWDGGGEDDNWDTAANWVSDALPAFTDGTANLIFDGSTRLAPNNNVAGAVLNNLVFGAEAASFDLTGNGFTIRTGLSNNSANPQTLSGGPIQVRPNAVISASGGDLNIQAGLDLGAGSDGAVQMRGLFTTTLAGPLTGLADLRIADSGTVRIVGPADEYQGEIFIERGHLRISSDRALGAVDAGTTLSGGGSNGALELSGGISVAEPITLGLRNWGSDLVQLRNLDGDNTLTGPIQNQEVSGYGEWFIESVAGKLTIRGDFTNRCIDGAPGIKLLGEGNGEWTSAIADNPDGLSRTYLVKEGGGTWTLCGNNTLTDGVHVLRGTLALRGPWTNNVAASPAITLYAGGNLDVTGLAGGGIVLADGQSLVGDGLVTGSVTAGPGSAISPGSDPGLTVTGGLTLADGCRLDLRLGCDSSLLHVTGGTVTGSGTGGVVVTIMDLGAEPASAYTLMDWSGASASGVDASDFALSPDSALEGTFSVVGTTLQFHVSSALNEYLRGGDAGEGLSLDASRLVAAVNAGDSVNDYTIQGVTFANAPVAQITGTPQPGVSGDVPVTFTWCSEQESENDDALQGVLSSLWFCEGGMDIAISGLTPGLGYKIDLLQSLGSVYPSREQAILLFGEWQQNVWLPQLEYAAVNTSLVAHADDAGEIVVSLRPSAEYGGTGPQDGCVLNGLAVASIRRFDYDDNGRVDALDLLQWEVCATGPSIPGPPPGCSPLQFAAGDADGDVISTRTITAHSRNASVATRRPRRNAANKHGPTPGWCDVRRPEPSHPPVFRDGAPK